MTKQKSFQANGLAVLIGSVPLADHGEALDWILEATPEVPLWPQLPSRPLERMLMQFSEGLPCIREDRPELAEGTIRFDLGQEGFEAAMLAFYVAYLAAMEDPTLFADARFAVSRERAAGLYLLADRLGGLSGLSAVKGQITGPFTMLTGVKDNAGRAGYFDDTVRDMVVKGIALKAGWQTNLLAASGLPVLLFIDEPALAGLGSSGLISVSRDDIQQDLGEVVAAIHQAGGLAGVHVCANTDWPMLLQSDIDVLSFDAYGFFDRLAALSGEVGAFLDRGAIIAWGIVPTARAEDIEAASAEALAARWEEQADALAATGRDRAALLSQTLITPSCGTGSLPPALARRVLTLTREVSIILRKRYLG